MPDKRKKPADKGNSLKDRTPSAEESDLWRQAMSGVAPLAERDSEKPGNLPPSTKQTGNDRGRPVAPPSVPRSGPDPLPNLDRRAATRLKRGLAAIEARIDLHGMTQTEAHRALAAFIEASWKAGRRSVLVITGKGSGESGGGVLRHMTPRWLGEPPHGERIIGISPAAARHGGEGALYVMLKRKNKRPERPEKTFRK